jgi:hypothetical protein
VKLIIIAGFADSVLKKVNDAFPDHVRDRSIILISRRSGMIDFKRFNWAITDSLAKGAKEFCFILAPCHLNWVSERIDEIIADACCRSGLTPTVEKCCLDEEDHSFVFSKINDFGLPPLVLSQYPKHLKDLERWADENLRGRVLIHPRALRGAKKSLFENPALILDALLLLATEYRDVRILGEDDARQQALENRLAVLGLELSEAISPDRAGEHRDEYLVKYPLGQFTRKELLRYHLKKGSDRDERTCLRIYFFWDKGMKLVVVGWLPGHLDTRST